MFCLQAVRKIAIQYLKLFFLASFERGSIYVQVLAVLALPNHYQIVCCDGVSEGKHRLSREHTVEDW